METVYRVNKMTLQDFMEYLRAHGVPCSLDVAKAWIRAGVFAPAAYACEVGGYLDMNGQPQKKYDYFIIPKRLDEWFQENADEVRVKNGKGEKVG